MELNEVKKTFKHLVEYTIPSYNVDEDEAQEMAPNAMAPDPNMMGGDPNVMGDPNAMPADPNMMGGDPNAMGGGAPDAGMPMDGGQAPQGFNPQGVDQTQGMEGMGGNEPQETQETEETEESEVGPDDNVIEVDDLVNAQETTDKKIEKLTSKFEKAMSSIDNIVKRVEDIDTHTNEYLKSLKDEIEKRNPTPMQRMTMRTAKSSPYSITPNEYMNNYAPDNYSSEPDNNGEDDPQYKITKGDIDDFTDYNSIAKEIADKKVGLNDIFGF